MSVKQAALSYMFFKLDEDVAFVIKINRTLVPCMLKMLNQDIFIYYKKGSK